MPAENMPAAEIDITLELVRSLLRTQDPDLAAHPFAPLAFGRDSALFRLGDATWARAHGWALSFALALLASSADNPGMARVGERTLAAVLQPGG